MYVCYYFYLYLVLCYCVICTYRTLSTLLAYLFTIVFNTLPTTYLPTNPPTFEVFHAAVQTLGALVEQHLAGLQVHRVKVAVVVLYLYGPRLVVVVVFVGNVHNRRDHVGVHLKFLSFII